MLVAETKEERCEAGILGGGSLLAALHCGCQRVRELFPLRLRAMLLAACWVLGTRGSLLLEVTAGHKHKPACIRT